MSLECFCYHESKQHPQIIICIKSRPYYDGGQQYLELNIRVFFLDNIYILFSAILISPVLRILPSLMISTSVMMVMCFTGLAHLKLDIGHLGVRHQ